MTRPPLPPFVRDNNLYAPPLKAAAMMSVRERTE